MGKAERGMQEEIGPVNQPDGSAKEEDRRKHLDFIQAVVTRMSAASSTAKSWVLPLVTATYGYALTQEADSIAVLGIVAVMIFAFLDANYLRQEKGYRKLYDAVAGLGFTEERSRVVPPFSMDPSDADDPIVENSTFWQKSAQIWRRWMPRWTVWCSWSVAPFYGSLFIVGVAIFLRVR